jgi:hypothetical protein
MFHSKYSVSVCCSVYYFCVNVYVLYCTVIYCTVLYFTVLYFTVLYCIVLYCTLLYFTVLYCTVLYCCHRVSTQLQSTNIYHIIRQTHATEITTHRYILVESRHNTDKIPSKKFRSYIYDVKFLALLGALYMYDIIRLRVRLVGFYRGYGITTPCAPRALS